MFKSTLSCLLLIFLIGAHAELKSVKLSAPQTPVTKSRVRAPYLHAANTLHNIDINTAPYLVDVEFGDSSSNPMALVLYNNKIVLSNCTKFFLPFKCDDFAPQKCVPFPNNHYSIDFPLFSMSGYSIHLNMSLGSFGQNQRLHALFSYNCQTGSSFGTNQTFGSIGLGIDSFNYQFFNSDGKKFSLALADDGLSGDLIFGEDASRINNDTIVHARGSTNWELPILSINLPMFAMPIDGNVIMDVSSNYIGLPDFIFNQLISHLNNTYVFICQKNVFIKPRCMYPGDLNALPSLHLYSPMAEDLISIHPDTYITHLGGQNFQLELVSLTTKLFSFGELIVNKDFENYVILGTPFLRKHYVVFDYNDYSNPIMSFSYRPLAPTPDPDSDNTGSIVFGVILCVFILGMIALGIFYFTKKNSENAAKSASLIPHSQQPNITLPTGTTPYNSYNQ